jgi:hypothetical protein
MATQREDLAFGGAMEDRNIGKYNKFFNTTFTKTPPYDPFDFTNGTIFVEQKSRRVNHNQYPTAIIGANKVKVAEIGLLENPTRSYYFCFCYLDGIFYLKYDKTLFDTFHQDYHQRGWRADAEDKPQAVFYIPHCHLTKLEITQTNTV